MLTPEQQAAAAATLRLWRRAVPYQVQCSYCGTLVWMQHAEPVPDNPADPYDRYACAACGADGRGQKRAGAAAAGRSPRRHKARQVRARIVELARDYKEACGADAALYDHMWRDDVQMTNMLYEEEQRTWDAMEHRRAALFRALEELEGLEEEG